MSGKKRGGHAVEVRTSFEFEFGYDAMLKVFRDEDPAPDHKPQWDPTLFDLLNEIEWVSGVDYDGHFGSCVYFTIEEASSHPERVCYVELVLRERIIQMMGIKYWKDLSEGKVRTV